MTLLTTEVTPTAAGDLIVFAADRRITRGAANAGPRPKIFRIPQHLAGIGYFGLAEVPTGNARQPMSEWLQDFFYRLRPSDTLADIASKLVAALNKAVPAAWLDTDPSGFHLAGLAQDGRAEFWYIRNLDDVGAVCSNRYSAREDFRSRDAAVLPAGATQIYRNGDVRAHVAAWTQIDASLGSLLGTPSFRALRDVDDYVDWVRFKMESIASFYERFATESIIGPPIDAFAIANGA